MGNFIESCSSNRTSSPSAVARHGCLVFAVVAFALSGCATTQDRGDRAFESGQYNQALDQYELAIEAGSRDAELYHRAAEAAVRVGDFSLAERYYSRAMRYGGGEKTARSMAEFYVATSNYTKAVRVLQELLETTDDPQSVFNNLGAALMYGGAPLDAESYLLVAQQMEPSDPVPYVNLGVLYDRHVHQPRLALGFYRCFLRMGESGGQRRKIEARVRALEASRSDDDSRIEVTCGEPYRPPKEPSTDDLQVAVGVGDGDDEGDAQPARDGDEDEQIGGDESVPPEESAPGEAGLQESQEQAGPDAGDQEPPTIYRQVDELPQEEKSAGDQPEAAPDEEPAGLEEAQRLAEAAFRQENYRDVLRYLDDLPASALGARSMALYGRSLAQLGEYKRAQRWLVGAVAESPDDQSVTALFEVYRELGATEQLHQLCERFEGDEVLEELREHCPEEQLREHLKNQQK